MKTGINLIAQERKEQLEKHNRKIEDDVYDNCNGELMQGALALLTTSINFPSWWDEDNCVRMNNKPLKERIVIAGALLAAELDRLIMVEESAKQQS